MTENDAPYVRLDVTGGSSFAVDATFSIGRLDNNDLTIADEQVSRRHAIIQRQDEDEHWLIDLASSNGTHLNAQRLIFPTRLSDGDVIEIGPLRATFRKPHAPNSVSATAAGPPETSISITTAYRWLLVVDVAGSTALATSMSAEELAVVMGNWMMTTSDIVKNNGGAINKYLGDGFLAYWRAEDESADAVWSALEALETLHKDPNVIRFRAVLHYGQVALGGQAAATEESLTGLNVGYVFRMESLASDLSEPFLLSAAAATQLGPNCDLNDIGLHHLPHSGTDEPVRFFSIPR